MKRQVSAEPRHRVYKSVAVSVVIPCYNSAQYLAQTVASAVQLTGCDIEIILVDDGSTDHTNDVISCLIADYPSFNIKRLYQSNQGVAAARNYGVREASGRYILPLDADDLIDAAVLLEAVTLLDTQADVAVVYGDRQDFGDIQAYWPAGKFALSYIKYFNQFAYCCLYRKDMWQALGGYKENINGFDDWDFWLALIGKGYQGLHIAKPLLQHRRHPSSQLWGIIDSYERLFAQIILNNHTLYAAKEVAAAQTYIDTGQSSSVISLSKRIFIKQYYKEYAVKNEAASTNAECSQTSRLQ